MAGAFDRVAEFVKALVEYGIDSGDWSYDLCEDGSNQAKLQQLCRSILETKWSQEEPEALEGTIAGKILQCWKDGKSGKELWKDIAEELEYDEKVKRSSWKEKENMVQEDQDKLKCLEEGMLVKTHDDKELKLHATDMQKQQQGVFNKGRTPQWTLPAGEVAEVTQVHPTGSFRLQRQGGDESFLAAPSIARRLCIAENKHRLNPPEKMLIGKPKEWADELKKKWPVFDDTNLKPITRDHGGQELKEAKIETPRPDNLKLIFTAQSMDQRPRSPYLGRSPIKYASDLLLLPAVCALVKTIKPVKREAAQELLGKIQRQEIDMGEPGVGGFAWQSLATNGFRAGNMDKAILIASIPGADQALYNDVLFMSLMHDFHFAITWEQHYGNVWLANWLRELLVGVVGGAKPIVITGAKQKDETGKEGLHKGAIGYAQTSEVFLCLALGIDFEVVFVKDLFDAFRPLVSLAKKKDWEQLEKSLKEFEPGYLQECLRHTDAAGKSALFTLIREAARPDGKFKRANEIDPHKIVKKLLDNSADPAQSDFYGWNSLHLAARFSTPKTIEVLVQCQPELLNKKDAKGRSPLYRAIKHQNKVAAEKLKELGATMDGTEQDSLLLASLAS